MLRNQFRYPPSASFIRPPYRVAADPATSRSRLRHEMRYVRWREFKNAPHEPGASKARSPRYTRSAAELRPNLRTMERLIGVGILGAVLLCACGQARPNPPPSPVPINLPALTQAYSEVAAGPDEQIDQL